MSSYNVDPKEIAHFSTYAPAWWDPAGPFKTLHDINKIRLDFILQASLLEGKQVLDVGCGGGILAEAMAARGAAVMAIDMDGVAIGVAKDHCQQSGYAIDYQEIAVESIARCDMRFDIITCLEMLEHVPDPLAIVQACGQLLKPEGIAFFSTINRTPQAYALAILGAEYVLGLLPRGTHDYGKFIRPSELAAWLAQSDLELTRMRGIGYNPFTREAYLTSGVGVNYIVEVRKLLG